jgi:rubrerythrin
MSDNCKDDDLNQHDHKMCRRGFCMSLAGIALSSTALTLLGGANYANAARGYDPRQDVFFLNKALRSEHDLIMSYDFSIETGQFEKTALTMFNFIQTDHLAHKDQLVKVIKKLGGKPVASRTREEFEKDFNAELIRTATDALRLNKTYESQGVSIYAEIATYMQDPSLSTMAARFSSEELTHKAFIIQAIASIPFDPTLRIRD